MSPASEPQAASASASAAAAAAASIRRVLIVGSSLVVRRCRVPAPAAGVVGGQWVRILPRKSLARSLRGLVKNSSGVGLLDDLAVGHEDDPVGGRAGEAHLVGDDDHRHAARGRARP